MKKRAPENPVKLKILMLGIQLRAVFL